MRRNHIRGGNRRPGRGRRRARGGLRSGRRLIVALAAVLALLVIVAPHRDLTGETRRFAAAQVRAVDADTIEAEGGYVRLRGIAAPEEGHPGFAAGRAALSRLIGETGIVECDIARNADRYGRAIGRCATVSADGTRLDLQAAMVRGGHARACPGWGTWRYLVHENAESLRLPFPGYCWPGKPF